MNAIGKKDIGKKRTCNEDAFFVSTQAIGPLPNLYVVADGMGGHNAGDYASYLAVEYLYEFIRDHGEIIFNSQDDIVQFLKRAVTHVNHKLFQKSIENPAYQGMGTTLTVSTIIDNRIYIAHVGDSRLYTINTEGMVQVTRDHSYVQEMVNKGYISQQEAKKHPKRNVITRAIGTYKKVQVDTYNSPLEDVQYILLCSDGITSMLSDDEIHQIIIDDGDLEQKVDELIRFANNRGGVDNITVVLAIYNEAVKMC